MDEDERRGWQINAQIIVSQYSRVKHVLYSTYHSREIVRTDVRAHAELVDDL